MILCLDVGNTQIHGGVYSHGQLVTQFRKTSTTRASSDEIGVFLRSVLRENNIQPEVIEQVGVCSVVPDSTYSIRNAVQKYFKISPFFLQAGVKTGLKIKYNNPLEVGADRIANAIAAVDEFPDQNLIIIDFGTATTFDVVTDQKEYLGGAILPGIRISMEVLEEKTAKLPSVEIVKPKAAVGKSTVESIQSGLFYGHLGIVKELRSKIESEAFGGKKSRVIGTGGFSQLFADEKIFDTRSTDLVLKGLLKAMLLNQEDRRR